MEQVIADLLRATVRVLVWSAVAPLLIARRLYRIIRRLAGARILATHDALPCLGCGTSVSLVGRFACGRCHYTFDGFAFSACDICGAVPPYISCQSCGVSLENPVH
jgi:hypothetical protein